LAPPPAKHLDNLFTDQNKLFSQDYSISDFTSDTDGILPRFSQEYPKYTNTPKTSINDGTQPWGDKMPLKFDYKIDAKIGPKFEKGRWYYANASGFDHIDFCGLPSHMSFLKTFFGQEFRQAFWANLYQRLILLEID
jgi:hypothetical protein